MAPNPKKLPLDYAYELASQGIPVFPVAPRNKMPLLGSRGYKDATTDLDIINEWRRKHPDANYGIPTGPISDVWVVDVDLPDGPEALKTLEVKYGQLSEDIVSQRTGGGGLQLFFAWNGTNIRNSTKKIGPGIDVRGDGGYVVGPGSIHPSGNVYEGDIDVSKITSAPKWLEDLAVGENQVEEIESTPIDGKVAIEEGTRNDTLFKIAATMRGKGDSEKQISAYLLATNKERCQPPLPVTEVKNIAKSVSSRYQAGTDLSIQTRIEEINQDHFVTMTGGRTLVVRETDNPELGKQTLQYFRASDFKISLQNEYVNPPGSTKPVALGNYWLSNPGRRQYLNGTCFLPGREAPEGYYNLFRGWGVDPKPGDTSLYWEHVLTILCAGNEEHYRYMRKWLAHIFQKPHELPGTAHVLIGAQGTGKGMGVEPLGRICGEHYFTTTKMDHVTGKFNAHIEGCVLLYANEAIWGGNKQHEGALKGLITDSHIAIERKGIDAHIARNYTRTIVSSNEDWAVPQGMDDRRFLAMRCSDARVKDFKYFERLHNAMVNGGDAALLYDLLHEDLGGWNPRAVPDSGESAENKIRSGSALMQWWHEKLQEGAIRGGDIFDESDDAWNTQPIKSALHHDYCHWCKIHSRQHPIPANQFGKKLGELLPWIQTNARPLIRGQQLRCFRLPPLDQCRDHFAALLGAGPGMWEDIPDFLA